MCHCLHCRLFFFFLKTRMAFTGSLNRKPVQLFKNRSNVNNKSSCTQLILPRYSAIFAFSQFNEREFHKANYYNNQFRSNEGMDNAFSIRLRKIFSDQFYQ